MDGKFDKHNVRFWGSEKPQEIRDDSRDSEKVTNGVVLVVN